MVEHKQINFNIKARALTVNKAWQGRRFKTKEYESFEKEVMYQLPKMQVKGEVEMSYKFRLKNYAITDVSNLLKCLEDIIVKAGLIEDDRKVVKIIAEKMKNNDESIQILIKQYEKNN